MTAAAHILETLRKFGDAQRGYNGLAWWFDHIGSSYFVQELEATVTVVEAIDNATLDSYGDRWGGGDAHFVVQLSAKCQCGEPRFYKISGESTSYGVTFDYPTIRSVEKKQETVSRYV
jgi:hypothetical protein